MKNAQLMGLGVSLLFCCASHAADTLIETVPTAWRLQNYLGGSVVYAFFTPSNCTNGMITLPGTATVASKNRFWSLVLAGKLSQKKVFVVYNNSDPNCTISSFGMEVP